MYKTRCIAILINSAGYGWAGGHFIPSDSPIIAYLFQAVVILILIILAVPFFSQREHASRKTGWVVKGFNIYFSFSLLVNILNILHGAFSHGSSYGSHNSFADLVPVTLIMLSCLLWFGAVLVTRKTQPRPY
jgi:uncharacterized membrane protein YhaH (DUF805 family)